MLSLRNAYEDIVSGIVEALNSLEISQVEDMINALIQNRNLNKQVLIVGAGRSGLVGKAFAMRLMHLGFDVFVIGETITPAFGEEDIVFIISGSGSTTLPVTIAKMAKRLKTKVILVTSYPNSPLGKIADLIVTIPGREGLSRELEYTTRQLLGYHESLTPMGTIFEDSCMVFLDSVIAELMARLKVREETMKRKHATIE